MIAVENAPDTLLKKLFSGPAAALLLAALVVCTYAYSASFDYIWDDDAYVTDNPHLRSFDGLSRIWVDVGATPQYYPVTFTSFWIEYQLFGTTTGVNAGLSPVVPHTTNILLHLGCVLLLWTVLRKLSIPGAWFAAALFAVHPINVESVAWVTERKNVLSMLFALLALWVYLRYVGLIAPPEKKAPRPKKDNPDEDEDEGVQFSLPDEPWRLYALFLFLFVCALLSKTTTSVLPGVILVIVWWKRGRLTLGDFKPLIVPILLGLGAGSITSYLEHNPYHIGATGKDWDYSIADRIVLAGQASWFYVGKLLLPHPFALGLPDSIQVDDKSTLPWTVLNISPALRAWLPGPLAFSYPRWALSGAQPLQWLGTFGVVGVLGALWALHPRIGRGALACVLIYLGCLVPAMGFVNVYPMRFSFVADHFAHMASVGLFVLVAAGAALTLQRARSIVLPVGLGAAVLALLMSVSIIHSHSMRDASTLWTSTLHRNGNSFLAAGNLGNLMYVQGRARHAQELAQGNTATAVAALERGIRHGVTWLRYAKSIKPDSYEAYYQLALLAEASNETDIAIEYAMRSEQLASEMSSPKSRVGPLLFLAKIYTRRGDYDRAERLLLELQSPALEGKMKRSHPNTFADARLQYVDLLRKRVKDPMNPTPQEQQVIGEAMQQLSAATELLPADQPGAPMRVALRLSDLGQIEQAAQMVADAIKEDPSNPDAQYVSATILVQMNQLTPAGAQLSKLINQHRSFMPARTKLAEVLVQLDRKAEAIQQLKLALELEPRYAPALDMLAKLENPTTQPSTQPTTQPTGDALITPATQPTLP